MRQALQAVLLVLWWGLGARAAALPSSQQYLWPSLPVGLQKELKKAGSEGRPDTIYDVVRFNDGTLTLWLISGPQSRCQAPPPELSEFQGPECPVSLYLEERRAFKAVGEAHGALTIGNAAVEL